MKNTSGLSVTAVMLVLGIWGCAWAEPADENDRWPTASIIHDFAPPGESNVRSSFRLAEGVALIGTEETADIYKTEDAGQTWRKTFDGYEQWDINDVRNFIRARDGRLYATTTEPALVIRSGDEGETWEVVAKAPASRTVALTELHDGTILVGLRRSANNKISILRSEDGFKTFDWIALDDKLPRQNVTCLIEISEGVVLAGVGYEGSGKIFKSTDAGKTWRQTAEFPDARDLMSFFKEGDRIYVTASGIATLYASDDAGKTWYPAFQVWKKGFLGESTTFNWHGKTYRVLSATDQRQKPYRHVLLISADGGQSWREWVELAKDDTGGCSNVTVISNDRLIAGTGNHSAQAHVYTVEFR